MITVMDSLMCLACLWQARSEVSRMRSRPAAPALYPALWMLLAFILALLALQGTTGMLDSLTDAARQDAITGGWYGDRRPFQWLLVRTVPVTALIAGLGAFWLIRAAWRRYLLVVVATLYWASFAAIQGISFHNIDWLLRQRSAGLLNKTWGDLAGAALTAAALLIAWRTDQKPDRSWGHRAPSKPQAPPPLGRMGRLGEAAGRGLQAEGRIFAAWYARYRAHRSTRSPRKNVTSRKK